MLTSDQSAYAEQVGNVCRSVWNTGLEQRRAYRQRGAWINYHEQARQLAQAKTEHPWLKQAPSHCLQQTLMDLDRACRERGTFKVRWRSGRRWTPSFRFPEGAKIPVEKLSSKWYRARLPKLGWVKFRHTRPLGGAIRSATVSRDGTHWYVSFLVEDGKRTPDDHPGAPIGVDRGVIVAAATSSGNLYDREFTSPGERRRYLRLQRKLAKEKKASRNRTKTITKLGAAARRTARRRTDFAAQTASQLAARHGLIVLEDLKTKNMTASAAGTVEAPGRNVAQKAGLNRAILGKGWNRFELALANAARYTGSRIIKVNPAYTSQACFACKHVAPESRKSQAVFRCVICGHRDHADVNAAKNILAAGLAVTACGDFGISRSMKQEPAAPRGKPRQPSQVEISRALARGEEVNLGSYPRHVVKREEDGAVGG